MSYSNKLIGEVMVKEISDWLTGDHLIVFVEDYLRDKQIEPTGNDVEDICWDVLDELGK